MKKILIALAAFMPFVFLTSCEQEDPQGDSALAEGTYYVTTSTNEITTVADGEPKSFSFNVQAEEEVGVANDLVFTLVGDPSLVDAYNTANGTEYEALPADCYSFTKSQATIYRYTLKSTTVSLQITPVNLTPEGIYVLPVTIGSVSGGSYKLAESPACYIVVQMAAKTSVDMSDALAQIALMTDDPCEPAPSTKTPDLIVNSADDMMKIPEILVAGETKYVVLAADVDMTGKSWVPFNLESPYDKGLEFNGQGHTIKNFTCNTGSYRSFYGIMNGRMYDVTFENAFVDGTNTADGNKGTQPAAVVAAYAGNKAGEGVHSYIYDVKVTGESEVKANGGGVGGLVGVAVNCIIKRCSVDITVNNQNRRAGGIVGYHNVGVEGNYLRIEDCCSAGSITGTQQVGGIIGQTQYDNGKNGINVGASLIRNCYSTMTIDVPCAAGGISGSCAYGGTYPTAELAIKKDVVAGCIAWNDKMNITGTTTGKYSSGAVVGHCNIYQYFVDNYRKPDMDFTAPVADGETQNAFNITPYDQDNSGDLITLKLVGESCPYAYQHSYPYHGKAAPAGSTVSSVAKALGWDEKVWDLSGSLPILK